jgi:hypothetical protein
MLCNFLRQWVRFCLIKLYHGADGLVIQACPIPDLPLDVEGLVVQSSHFFRGEKDVGFGVTAFVRNQLRGVNGKSWGTCAVGTLWVTIQHHLVGGKWGGSVELVHFVGENHFTIWVDIIHEARLQGGSSVNDRNIELIFY